MGTMALLAMACGGSEVVCEEGGDNCGSGASGAGGGGAGGSSQPGGVGAGSPGDVSSYCQAAASCEGWSNADALACEQNATQLEAVAIAAGCANALEVFDACLDDATCTAGSLQEDCSEAQYTVEECIEDALDPFVKSVCDEAAEVCGAGPEGEPVSCTASVQCAAQCIVDAQSCDVTSPALSDCIMQCGS